MAITFANIWCMQRRLIKLWGCSYVLLICSAKIYLGSELALAVELCSPGWWWKLSCGDLLLTVLKKNHWVCFTWALYAVGCHNLKTNMFPAKTIQAVEWTMSTLRLESKLGGSVWGLSHLSKSNSSVLQNVSFLAILLLVFCYKNEDCSTLYSFGMQIPEADLQN